MNCILSKASSLKNLNRGGATKFFFSGRGMSSVITHRTSKLITSQTLPTAPTTPTTSLKQFMNTTKRFSTLADILKREVTEEVENPLNEMPEDLSELKSKISDDWTIVDGSSASASDGATVKMYKKKPLPNGSKVTITFHCQDTLSPDEMGFLENAANAASDTLGGGNDEDYEDEEMSTPIKFDVTVSRAGKVLHLSCSSESAEATVDGVTVSNSEDDGENGDLYRGPVLEDLAEDLKDAFDSYLQQDIGVDEDVAAFIAMYADYREQMEYINWLKSVKNIVS